MQFDSDDRQKLEQLVQQTRWNEVADARQRVVDRLEAIDRMQFDSRTRLTQDECSLLTQRATKLYVEQVETVLDPVSGEPTTWWDNKLIGEFDIPTGRTVSVVGLSEYMLLDEQIPYLSQQTEVPHGGALPQTRQVERTITPPMSIHRSAFRATNRALADKGIEFDPRKKDVDAADVGGHNAV